ncbi:hypothetical protein [Sphingobium sp. MK2]|uniref:hypothetical protein n=1 Tax=Sphingobium sp. MK2 TaxID=3116540 RepID=UPI0032E35A58
MTDLRGQPGYSEIQIASSTETKTVFKAPKTRRGPKTVIVVENEVEGRLMQKTIRNNDHPNLHHSNDTVVVMWPGCMANSVRASAIIISQALYDRIIAEKYSPSVLTSQSAKRWWYETALCRLVPGARVICL